MKLAPHESHWSYAQRFALLKAADGRPRAGRPIDDDTLAVAAYIVATTPRAALRTGAIAGHTRADVIVAVAELEDRGLLAPGSAAIGRPAVIGPAILELFGLTPWGIGTEVRPDVRPVGPADLAYAALAEIEQQIHWGVSPTTGGK